MRCTTSRRPSTFWRHILRRRPRPRAHARSRSRFRRPYASEESGVHNHSSPDARPRCRREHRDFQCRERGASSPASVREPGAARDNSDRHEGAKRHQLPDRAGQHARPQGTRDRLREYCGDQCGTWELRRRRRKARADHHCRRHARISSRCSARESCTDATSPKRTALRRRLHRLRSPANRPFRRIRRTSFPR